MTYALIASRSGLSVLLLLLLAGVARADQPACIQAHADSQILTQRGALLAARQALLRCAQRDCPAVLVDDCASRLAQLERLTPSVVFAVSDDRGHDLPDARVSRNDGAGTARLEQAQGRAVPLDPGVYTFSVEAPGKRTVQEQLVIREAEQNRIVRFSLLPATEPAALQASAAARDGSRPPPLASYVLGGTALVSAVTAATFGILTEVQRAKLNDACALGDPCPAGEPILDRGNAYRTTSFVAAGVAAVSVSAALLWYVLDRPHAEHAGMQLRPSLAPSAAQLHWLQRF